MGKGDKSTRRGKIFAGSYGNSRSHTANTVSSDTGSAKPARPAAAKPPGKAAPRKKA